MQCPNCGGPGGVQLLMSVAACDTCLGLQAEASYTRFVVFRETELPAGTVMVGMCFTSIRERERGTVEYHHVDKATKDLNERNCATSEWSWSTLAQFAGDPNRFDWYHIADMGRYRWVKFSGNVLPPRTVAFDGWTGARGEEAREKVFNGPLPVELSKQEGVCTVWKRADGSTVRLMDAHYARADGYSSCRMALVEVW